VIPADPRPLYGEACGKVILIGEHAVVYGVEGIALPIPLYVRVWLGRDAPLPSLNERWVRWFKGVAKTLTGEVYFPVKSGGELPQGAGLGSSSAFTVASLRALPQPPQEPEGLIALADEGERIFHGNPSGLDVRTVVLKKAIRFRRRREGLTLEPLPPSPSPFWLTLWITPEGPSTREMVEKVGRCLDEVGKETFLKEAGRIIEEAYFAFVAGDLVRLGEQLTAFHRWLKALKASTHLLDELVDLALERGALGAKLTGAGGGGALLAIWKTPPQAISLPREVRAFGPWEIRSSL
jgi:mevalonate kinase